MGQENLYSNTKMLTVTLNLVILIGMRCFILISSSDGYLQATGQEIPLVVKSCIKVLNMYGKPWSIVTAQIVKMFSRKAMDGFKSWILEKDVQECSNRLIRILTSQKLETVWVKKACFSSDGHKFRC